jgi:hypothetical protein
MSDKKCFWLRLRIQSRGLSQTAHCVTEQQENLLLGTRVLIVRSPGRIALLPEIASSAHGALHPKLDTQAFFSHCLPAYLSQIKVH